MGGKIGLGIVWILCGVAVLAAGGLTFYRNNTEFFGARHQKSSSPGPSRVDDTVVVEEPPTARGSGDTATTSHPQSATQTGSALPDRRLWVEIPDVLCTVADRADLRVRFTVLLPLAAGELRDEVLFKRGDIRMMVRSAVSRLAMAQISPALLAPVLRPEIDRVLRAGKVGPIECAAFTIEKVSK